MLSIEEVYGITDTTSLGIIIQEYAKYLPIACSDEDVKELWGMILHYEEILENKWKDDGWKDLLNGHEPEGFSGPRDFAAYFVLRHSLMCKQKQDIINAINDQTEFESKDSSSCFGRMKCSACGEFINVRTNGIDFKCLEQCEFHSGEREFTTEINVPSGKIIFCDNLTEPYEEVNPNYDVSLNYMHGKKQYALRYAEQNVGMGSIGNCSPEVFETAPNQFLLCETPMSMDPAEQPLGELKGRIITDLWWYMLADLDEYTSKGGEVRSHAIVVNVQPGRYKITHLELTDTFLLEEEDEFGFRGRIHARIERID